MARPRAKNSKNPFGGMKLDDDTKAWVLDFLEEKDISFLKFKRSLIQQFRETRTVGFPEMLIRIQATLNNGRPTTKTSPEFMAELGRLIQLNKQI